MRNDAVSTTPDPESDGASLSRRRFLIYAGAAGGLALFVPGDPGDRDGMGGVATAAAFSELIGKADDMARLIRREDLLTLNFRFYNLARAIDARARRFGPLVRLDSGKPAFLVVGFPPQHLTEQAFIEASVGESEPLDWPAHARLSGPTQLAFVVPESVATIPFTVDALLDWLPFTPSVVPSALPEGANPTIKPRLRAPFPESTSGRQSSEIRPETFIEAPWSLMLSPSVRETWSHATEPVESGGWTELWHSRLARRNLTIVPGPPGTPAVKTFVADERGPRRVRAVWATDHGHNLLDRHAFGMPMAPGHPSDIVNASANFTRGYVPEPVNVNRLMLSPLGAWLDLEKTWPKNETGDYSIQTWRHKAALGRDNFVRIVDRGYLMPFGHPAVFIQVTERQLASHSGGEGAFLRKRQWIVVTQPVRTFAGETLMPHRGREMPFTQVEVVTRQSPSLASETFGPGLRYLLIQSTTGIQPFRFDVVGTDWDGRQVPFSLPLVFAEASTVDNRGDGGIPAVVEAIDAYNQFKSRRTPLGGQRVSIAASSSPGDTEVQVQSLTFATERAIAPPGDLPLFAPRMDNAEVRLPAVEAITGTPGNAAGTMIEYPLVHLDDAADNPAELFATLPVAADLRFSPGSSGGVGVPDLQIEALSRTKGVVADRAGATADRFNPQTIFGSMESATLLGGLELKDIILAVPGLDQAPRLVRKLPGLPPNSPIPESPSVVDLQMEWRPTLRPGGPSITASLKTFQPRNDASLVLSSRSVTDRDNPELSSTVVRGELRNVDLHLVSAAHVVSIDIKRLAFESRNGAKPDFQVELGKFTFHGPLRFVDELRKWVSFGQDTLSISPSPSGIRAATALPIPSIQVGVFGLSNLVFHGAIDLPFDGSPLTAEIAFSSRSDPFSLNVGPFAGGGFFLARFGSNGIERIEGALEFGGQFALSIPFASGSVYAKAGIYFSYVASSETTTLAGYLTMGGELQIAGVVSLSVQFDLELAWINSPTKSIVRGRATVIVEVEVLGMGDSVELTAERSFGGSPADPTFGDQLDPPDWQDYCAAFAPIGANS